MASTVDLSVCVRAEEVFLPRVAMPLPQSEPILQLLKMSHAAFGLFNKPSWFFSP